MYEHEIATIIVAPHLFQWRAHGNGFLKTYLDPEKTVRLNIFHSSLRAHGVSHLHTHPWGLRSQIVAGELRNQRYLQVTSDTTGAEAYVEGVINCENFNGVEDVRGLCYLAKAPLEVYGVGDSYRQDPHEIHESFFIDGTVTVMHRIPAPETNGEASVFWPDGTEYGDASRRYSPREFTETISAARRNLGL